MRRVAENPKGRKEYITGRARRITVSHRDSRQPAMRFFHPLALAAATATLSLIVAPAEAVDAAGRRGGAAKARAASTLVAGLVVDNSECLQWCPDALTNGQHDPKTVCEWSQCSDCGECKQAGHCDAWCPEALTNGQHDPKAVCNTWEQCAGCSQCDAVRAAKPKACEAKPCKNAAVCMDNADGSFACECTPGYEGVHCEKDTDDCAHDPCDNGGKCVDEVNGYSCECTEGFTGKHCEEPEPAGMPHIHDPASHEAKEEAQVAFDALNALRAKAGKPSLSIKRIVSYQTQVVMGMLHTFCIETQASGDIQLTWDEDASGKSHLSSVKPLYQSMKWYGDEPTEAFACSDMPIPYDPRPEEDRAPPTALVEVAETSLKAANKAKTTASLTSEFPEKWDARKDHPRSKQCAAMIEHPQNQGTCGSCYAYAALGAASIRACMAGHDEIPDEGFSVQDVLSCGTNLVGDFQNFNKYMMHKGSRFANNCEGYQPHNVYEYAVKHGLVAQSCQPNAHGPDPLTGLDGEALAEQCKIKNRRGSVARPEIDVWNPPSKNYVRFVDTLRDAVTTPGELLTPSQKRELRRIAGDHSADLATLDDAAILKTMRRPANANLVKQLLGKPKDKLVQMKLAVPLAGYKTVAVDNDKWCETDSSKTRTWEAFRSNGASAVCMGKMNYDISKKRGYSVMPKEYLFSKALAVEGDEGTLIGNVDKEFCSAVVSELAYWRGRSFRGKKLRVGSHQLIQFHEVGGKNNKGQCHRDKLGDRFNPPKGLEEKECKTHKIFSTPVKVVGEAQTEAVMMRAIMELGAIDVTFETPKSFMHWTGPGVYPGPSPGEEDAPHAAVLFGWGEENGKKFWWGKNSWGDGPEGSAKRIFKYARGENAGKIESNGAGWISVDAPGEKHKDNVILPTINAKGFCEDDLLDESIRADKSKIDAACVALTCEKSGDSMCVLEYTGACPKDKNTLVRVVSESNYRDVPGVAGKKQKLRVRSACIVNVITE